MPVSVTMPQLGESVTEGTVTRWLKKEGETVEVDEPLLEVSTDKVDTEIPSPAAGVLTSIAVAEDETVEVGALLATIAEAGEAAAPAAPPAAAPAPAPEPEPAPAPPAPPAPPGPPAPPVAAPAPVPSVPAPAPAPAPAAWPPAAPAAPAASVPAPAVEAEGAYVTPLVRKMASELGVDLATVKGTGVGGRIRKQDVQDAAKAKAAAPVAAPAAAATPVPAPAPAPVVISEAAAAKRGTTEKLSRLRQTIARRMVESLQVSAQLTTVVEVDVTKIARLRDRAKGDFLAREGVKLSFMPFFALATIEALKVHPNVNAVIDSQENTVTYHDAEHLGFAVDTDKGLIVPVIKDAGELNLAGIARKIADLAERTRTNRVSPDELGGGTFTLTNTGSRGALFDTPIINQPQVGILGTGSVVKRPVVVNDPSLGEVIAIRSMVYLALTYDHRIVDGADAARFLTTVKNRLEEGHFESDLGL